MAIATDCFKRSNFVGNFAHPRRSKQCPKWHLKKFQEDKKMKRMIMIVVTALFVLTSIVNAQTRARRTATADSQKVRLQIVSYGFQNEEDALLAISQFVRQANPNVVLVLSNPDQILEVSSRTFMFKSWTEYDRRQVRKNAQARAATRVLGSILGGVRTNSRILNDVIYEGENQAYQEAYHRQDNEYMQLEKWRSDVTVRLLDPQTRQVHRGAVGNSVIVVEHKQRYYAEPQLILVDGDLSAVGIQKGQNLDGALRQVLALAAFYDANNAKNIVGGN
jgi:hypothetical protein